MNVKYRIKQKLFLIVSGFLVAFALAQIVSIFSGNSFAILLAFVFSPLLVVSIAEKWNMLNILEVTKEDVASVVKFFFYVFKLVLIVVFVVMYFYGKSTLFESILGYGFSYLMMSFAEKVNMRILYS